MMPTPIADDFSAIRARMKEIAAGIEPRSETEECETCGSRGWVEMQTFHPPSHSECPDCCNPNKHPVPGS